MTINAGVVSTARRNFTIIRSIRLLFVLMVHNTPLHYIQNTDTHRACFHEVWMSYRTL